MPPKTMKTYQLKITDNKGERNYDFTDDNLSRLLCEHSDYQNDAFVSGKWEKLNIAEQVKGKTVLDIGCNSGRQMKNCLEAGAKSATGIDSNWRYLEDCVDNGVGQNLRKAELNDPNALRGLGHFDITLLLATLHYVEDKAEFIRQVASLTDEMLVLESPVENGEPDFAPKQEELEQILNENFARVEFCGESISPSKLPSRSKRFIWKAYKR